MYEISVSNTKLPQARQQPPKQDTLSWPSEGMALPQEAYRASGKWDRAQDIWCGVVGPG